jgi:hypothetical protein
VVSAARLRYDCDRVDAEASAIASARPVIVLVDGRIAASGQRRVLARD